MRVILAAAAALAMTTSIAVAAPWTDPNGRLTFDAPAGWIVAPQAANGLTYAVAVGNTAECHVIAVPRPGAAESGADLVHIASQTQVGAAAWTNMAGALPNLFQGGAQVITQSVDDTPFWAVQTAQLRTTDGRTIYGGLQFRPGLELWSFCQAFDGSSDTATYDRVAHSLGTPNDQQFHDDVARMAADREEAQRVYLREQERQLANQRREYEQNRHP